MPEQRESFTAQITRESEYLIEFSHNGNTYQVKRCDCDSVAYFSDGHRAVLTMSREVYNNLHLLSGEPA